MRIRVPIVALFALGLLACEEEPSVSFASPSDGATVSSPVSVQMRAEHFTIEPAGETREGHGHFHIVVDEDCVTPGQPIPRDDAHIHYGNGQTEAQLELAPGAHRLCLQVGDGAHTALDLTQQIRITVSE